MRCQVVTGVCLLLVSMVLVCLEVGWGHREKGEKDARVAGLRRFDRQQVSELSHRDGLEVVQVSHRGGQVMVARCCVWCRVLCRVSCRAVSWW